MDRGGRARAVCEGCIRVPIDGVSSGMTGQGRALAGLLVYRSVSLIGWARTIWIRYVYMLPGHIQAAVKDDMDTLRIHVFRQQSRTIWRRYVYMLPGRIQAAVKHDMDTLRIHVGRPHSGNNEGRYGYVTYTCCPAAFRQQSSTIWIRYVYMLAGRIQATMKDDMDTLRIHVARPHSGSSQARYGYVT